MTKRCQRCLKEFLTFPCRVGKFCSYHCSAKGRIHHSGYKWNKASTEKRKGEGNPGWVGDRVKYFGLHMWVSKNFGQPGTCEQCGRTRLKGRYIHWANKTGKYLRDRNDWMRLCAKCHVGYDGIGFKKGNYLNPI